MSRVASMTAFVPAAAAVGTGLPFAAAESWEVVKVTSVNESGAVRETGVWPVDINEMHSRAGSSSSGWLVRVCAGPLGVIEHAGEPREVRLVEAGDETAKVSAHMARKHGFADRFAERAVGTFVARCNVAAQRLVGP